MVRLIVRGLLLLALLLMGRMRTSLVLLLVLASSPLGVVRAQDPVVVIRPGDDDQESYRAAARAVRIFNRSATTRIFGSATFGRNEVLDGDVGVFDGRLIVYGIIEGDLVAIDADVRLKPTAEVDGDILLVGGSIDRDAGARVRGVTRRYRLAVDIRRVGDELDLMERRTDRVRVPVVTRRRPRFGSTDASIEIGVGPSYNRVEGLPIHFGPSLTWGNNWYNRLHLEALGIYRTAANPEEVFDSSLSRRDVGYTVNAEMQFGRSRALTLGGRVFDVIAPIEDWQLNDDEVGFATFLLHRDYRDYYMTRGWSAYATIRPVNELTFSGAYAREEQTSVEARDPWTLSRRSEEWRENPDIDEGDFTILSASAEYDSRYSRRYDGSGWFFSAEWERGMSDNVVDRVLPLSIRDPLPVDGDYMYDRFFLDLRRYERVGWSGQLSLRGVFAGTIGENDPLPVQRRLSIGHVMPGFGFRPFTCNGAFLIPAEPALCDNVLLFQAEYRADLSFRRRSWRTRRPPDSWGGSWRSGDFWGWDDWDDWFWFDGPSLVVFSDAGTGWLHDNDIGDLEFDIGAGVEFGSMAVYAAKAITSDEGVRFTFRLHRRF